MSIADRVHLITLAIVLLWAGWLLSWMIASRWSAPVEKRPPFLAQVPDRVITIGGAILLALNLPPTSELTRRLYFFNFTIAWSLVGLIALGIAICWWARLHLGRMWSGTVTQKEDHRIIDSGPYGIVRHPIYTGILLSLYATAALKATWLSFIGVGLTTLGFYMKARLEERFLSQDLGEEYEAYRRRVPMLIPFIGV